jgi:hypothetical protein
MQARMSNPATIVPDAMQALVALAKSTVTTRQVTGEWSG